MLPTTSRALTSDFSFDEEGSPRGRERTHELSAWPLVALYVGYPVWWLLGFGDMVWPVLAVPMLANLLRLGQVRAPKGFGIWVLFLLWMSITVIQVDSGPRLAGFLFRAASYLAATVIFLYVYNASERVLPLRRLACLLAFFWAFVVAGGYLGIARPTGRLDTVMAHLLPGGLQANSLVSAMVHPAFAQLNASASAEFVLPRPSAPFLYTNGWGSSYSLLLPIVLVALLQLKRGPAFWLLVALIPVSLVPAFLTLNRGMFLALGVGLSYVAVRFAFRREVKGILAVGLLVSVIGLLTVVLPVQDLVTSRVSNSDTNATRAVIYREAFDRTLQSPLLGFGTPRPSFDLVGGPSAGTQGQFWLVLFSHGFPGAALFLGWVSFATWRTRRAVTTSGLWLHVVCVMMLLECFYYGMLTSGLVIFMIAAAAALRSDDRGRVPRASP